MRYAGELAALGTAVLWAAGANFFAAAGRRVGSQNVNRLRITVATGLLALALLVVKGSVWPMWATRDQIGLLALSGLVGFVFGDSFNFRSLVILGPGRGALLMSLAPLFTALLAWPVLHERLGPLSILGMALTLGGVLWVVWERGHGRPEHVEGSALVGIVSGVLGALGQAGGYVLSKLALKTGLDPLSATVVRIAAAAIVVWALAPFTGGLSGTVQALRDRRAGAFIFAGAVCGPFLGVTLSLAALLFIQAGVAASITAISPLFAILIASRFHGERLTPRILLGATVAVAGVIVLFLR